MWARDYQQDGRKGGEQLEKKQGPHFLSEVMFLSQHQCIAPCLLVVVVVVVLLLLFFATIISTSSEFLAMHEGCVRLYILPNVAIFEDQLIKFL